MSNQDAHRDSEPAEEKIAVDMSAAEGVEGHPAMAGLDAQVVTAVVRAVAREHARFSGRLSVAFVGDEQMHALNRETLQHDYTTDVLSWDYTDPAPDGGIGEAIGWLEGELVINPEYAAREAPRHGHPAPVETLLYLIHGLLHLLGFDDVAQAAREQMVAEQERLLAIHRGRVDRPE